MLIELWPSKFVEERTRKNMVAARREATTYNDLLQIDRRYLLQENKYFSTRKLTDIDISMRKLENFINETRTLVASDSSIAQFQNQLAQLRGQLSRLRKQYQLWWEIYKLIARDVFLDVINFVRSFTTKLLNFAKKIANFCTSIVGLGEHFKIQPFKTYEDPYIQQKYQELNQKEAKKQQLQTKITQTQKELQREKADLKLLKQNQDMKNRLFSHVKYFIEQELPEIRRKVQTDLKPRM